MKFLLLVVLSLSASAGMFDQMREQFVDQVEMMTETSDLPLSAEKHEVLEGREERLDRQEIKKEKELQRMRANADRMQAKIKQKETLKQEVKVGGNTYLDMTMNMRTNIPKKSEYHGLLRTWEKRTNTNGVGVITLTGVGSEADIVKYHKQVQSKYKFINTSSYKTPSLNTATSEYIYDNRGDRIIFSVHTTKYRNPARYKMVVEYTSKEEVPFRPKK